MLEFTEVINKALRKEDGKGMVGISECLTWLVINNALNGISSKCETGGMAHITNEELDKHFEKFKSFMLDNGFSAGVTEIHAVGVTKTLGVYFKPRQLSQTPDEFCITVVDFREKEIYFGAVPTAPTYIDSYAQRINRML